MSHKMDLKQAMALRLKEFRNSKGLTQERMAFHFDIWRTTYSNYELGQVFPNYLFLQKVANDFNVSLDWYICGKGSMLFKDEEELKKEAIDTYKNIGVNEDSAENPEAKVLSKEHREMIEDMEKTPLLHYEIMAYYHRLKARKETLPQGGGPSDAV
ncbi:MAG: helix-turn-helix domain-containing protein [Candidatus Omnitrophota bacterium]